MSRPNHSATGADEAPAVLLRRVIAASGLSATRWAREVAWRDPRSVRRWLAGESIPPEALRQIERLAADLVASRT